MNSQARAVKALHTIEPLPFLTNKPESKKFLKTALAWHGSVTPHVLPRVISVMLYALLVYALSKVVEGLSIPITPFEYSGAVLGLLLVLRVNAGLDRWWEARKIWGSIVNQSRNLAIIGYEYTETKDANTLSFLNWVAAWPHVMRESLRQESELKDVVALIGEMETAQLKKSNHMPTYVGAKIARLLQQLRGQGLDNFAFQRAEKERALLIDAIGACERIRKTPIPHALAIKTRRFILLFLLLLPFALVDRAGMLTPLIVALASYPLFSLDEIGAELQNPFSPRNVSHLPLADICKTIEGNVLSLKEV